jgi:hypothetical protein
MQPVASFQPGRTNPPVQATTSRDGTVVVDPVDGIPSLQPPRLPVGDHPQAPRRLQRLLRHPLHLRTEVVIAHRLS